MKSIIQGENGYIDLKNSDRHKAHKFQSYLPSKVARLGTYYINSNLQRGLKIKSKDTYSKYFKYFKLNRQCLIVCMNKMCNKVKPCNFLFVFVEDRTEFETSVVANVQEY